MNWKPDWELAECPCEDPDTCTPKNPTCSACINGLNAFLNEFEGSSATWVTLKEWQRETWRREATGA